MNKVNCDNTYCKFHEIHYGWLPVCGLPHQPTLTHWSDDMHPDIMLCMSFEKGESNFNEIRDENGYYPGQKKEPS